MLENIRIVLVNTSHPGNIGAAARAMKNMGLSKLVLVEPKEFPSYEAYSRAAGADDLLGKAVSVSTLSEAVEGCVWVAGTSARERSIPWPLQAPRVFASECVEKLGQGEIAVVFGRERTGLTNEELELCNVHINIPTDDSYSSLNVAAAVQILCYELRLALVDTVIKPTGKTPVEDTLASADQLEGMFEHMHQTMTDVEFLGTSNPAVIMRRLKSLFLRAQPSKREVNILRGFFTAVQSKDR